MKENIVFSIIVPVYRVEEYIHRCVDSLLRQTYPHIEVILVDDGSPDGCPAICDAYARQDARVKVIHKPNGGQADARNRGLEIATGDYIVFVDSDDYIEQNSCQQFLPFAQKGYEILVADGVAEGGYSNMSHGNVEGCCTGKEYLKVAVPRGKLLMATVLYMYRRDFLESHQLRFKAGIRHEDEHFIPRAFLAANTVIETGVVFYHYVIREGSTTTVRDLRKNAVDLYGTCLELGAIYRQLEDKTLQRALLDSLVVKYLSLFQAGKLYRYGKEYIHKDFVRKNAFSPKTRLKAALFVLSPRLYWQINYLTKR
jgi:glycosyltransferase involved in cell wall biosynthesis